MKKAIFLALALMLVAGTAMAASVVSSKHDMRSIITNEVTTQVCVYCHTPHQAAGANKQDPLWNHTGTATAVFGVYASTTLNAVPSEIGGDAMGSQTVSKLCMSCHDGTVAVFSLYKAPKDGSAGTTGDGVTVSAAGLIITGANIGTDLTDDHPINFTYDGALATADGGLVTPDSSSWVDVAKTVPLYGAKIQCASCHKTHDPANVPFLRVANTASALCLKCHVK